MASKQKEIASVKVPDYSRTRVYRGTLEPLSGTGFWTIEEFVNAMNDRLIKSGRLPVSCGDYPSSEKKLIRLVKRWHDLPTVQASKAA